MCLENSIRSKLFNEAPLWSGSQQSSSPGRLPWAVLANKLGDPSPSKPIPLGYV